MNKSRPDGTKNIIGWVVLLLSLAVTAGNFALAGAGCPDIATLVREETALIILFVGLVIAGLAFAVIGRLLTLYRPQNRIGWLMAGLGLILPANPLLTNYVSCATAPGSTLLLAGESAWLLMVLSSIAILSLFVLLPTLFPDGAFQSPGWKKPSSDRSRFRLSLPLSPPSRLAQ